MRLAVIAAVIALVIGLGVGYLMWGERAPQAPGASDQTRMREAQQTDQIRKQADEIQKLKEELASERDQRQRLQEAISRGRK